MRQIFGRDATARAVSRSASPPAEDASDLHKRAKSFYKNGNASAAIPLYIKALEIAPGLAEARFHLGVALHATGDDEAALRECLAAIDTGQEPPAAWFESARRLADGVGGRETVAPEGGDTARQIRRGNVLRIAGRFVEAEAAYRYGNSGARSGVFALHRLACMLALLGRADEADEMFVAVAGAGIAFDASLHFGKPTLAAMIVGKLPIVFSGDFVPAGSDPVVLLSGDPLYLRRFASPLLASLLIHTQFRFAVQVHMIDPDSCLESDLRFSIGKLGLPVVAFSSEHSQDIPALKKTIYACARYRLVHSLLVQSARPVLVLDLDTLVLAPLFMPDPGSCDAAWTRLHNTRWDPWDTEHASLAWFMPTLGGICTAEIVAAYIGHEVASGRSPWFLDQIALFAARVRALQLDPPPVIMAFPPSTVILPHEYAQGARGAFMSMTHSLPENYSLLAESPFLDFVPISKKCFGWVIPGYDVFFEDALRGAPIEGGRARWEHQLIDICFARIQTRRRAIDAGAHVGFWSVPLATVFDRVDAFESHGLHQACFDENVTARNVILHRAALGAEPSRMAIETVALNSGMSRMCASGAGDVEVRALDDFGFEDVDFIKVDVEGFELPLLEGARNTLQRCRPLVLIEHGPQCKRYGFEQGTALRLLESMGARCVGAFDDYNFLFAWD